MNQPKTIAKYELLAELGRGGFATVYRARDRALEREVALKVLHPWLSHQPGFAARFQREARAAAALDHPHIVTVYDAGQAEGQLYLAMAYLPGRTLRDLLADEGPLPLERALPILAQIAEALDYAHAQGVIHRDVKPGNIMVAETAAGPWVTLLDFGLVKALAKNTALTSQGTLLGSPEYMAPEQADPNRIDEVGPAADRYALGVVAYHMLTGRVPFPGNTPATLYAHEHKPVPPPRDLRPDLPEPAAEALLKMLAKAPAERYPSAGEFVAALRGAWQTDRQAHQREAQLAPLYQRLQAAADRQDWAEVLSLGGGISALEANYRDVPRVMARAREQLRRPEHPPQQPKPAEQTPVPAATGPPARKSARTSIAWGVGLLAFAGVLCVIIIVLGPGLWSSLISPPTEIAKAPTATPTATQPPSPTDTPTATTPQSPTSPNPPADASRGDTWTRPADGMTMVYVPAGSFRMGSTDDDPDADGDEKPQHEVTLAAFWIDRTEVTNAQYARCVEAGACQPSAWADDATFNGHDYPVVGVSWQDATNYCQWAGGRLPTEAEWEYAARGPEGRIYPWGSEAPTCDLAQFADCSGRTVPVASYPDGASWVEALDMAGNVWEWVNDWYNSDYYASSPAQNPPGPATGDTKVLRGGGWYVSEAFVRAANRSHGPPGSRNILRVGVRCVVAPGN